MLSWLLYVLVVSALLSLAAAVAEQGFRRRHWPTRWIWIAAMILIALVSWWSASALLAPAGAAAPSAHKAWLSLQRAAPYKLPPLTSSTETVRTYRWSLRANADLLKMWVLSSSLLAVSIAISAAQIFWRRRRWQLRLLSATCVHIAPETGPAVVGLLRPTIVLPQWVLSSPSGDQALILAHERAHLDARDPALLTAALIVLLLMPWNVPVWWLLHRLRHAIEVDCDARVLGAGHSRQAYGEALITVGQRRSRFIGAVAAMSESRTLLEKRIEIMTQRSHKPWALGFVALCLIALTIAAAATQVAPSGAAANRQEISLDAATLDQYVGNYQLDARVLSITRDGTQLSAQFTGEPPIQIFARAPTEFFYKVVDAEITFAVSDNGPATSATLHQAGHDLVMPRVDDASAQLLKQQLADRVAQQIPQPGSEIMLRRTITAIEAGMPNFDDMTPPLQAAVRRQSPIMAAQFKENGPMVSIEFKGVADSGLDKFLATYRSGKQMQWTIGLNPQGRIAALLVQPKF